MQLAELSVRRPVLATVLSLLVLLVGLVAFRGLQLREYPRIDEPVVTVSTRLVGAAAEVVESQLTKPLEDSIAGIDGVDILSSISRADESQITVRFKLEKDPDNAASDVRDRVARVRARLPTAVEEPVIAKVEADASPTVWLAFQSERVSPLEITDLITRIVKPRLLTVPGVADVRLNGDRLYALRVWLQPERLAAHRLTVQDVEEALRAQNLEVPAGRIESRQREFTVTARTDLNRVEEFGAVVLRAAADAPLVRLRDVARLEEAAEAERSSVRLNGLPAVATGVIRNATANPLEVAAGIRALLPQLRAELPEGVQVQVANDSTEFIDRAIRSVYQTLAEAVLLVALVVFVFLRSMRAALIPLVTIPVSLVGAFALIALAGFTVNTLTLLALVLAIGLVVDDAIVVMENIHRHIEAGLSPFQAAIRGGREIGFAVVAMTLTLAAVYAPLAFTPGRTGRLFAEFALTLAGAVVVSGFVALTLSPMMSSKLLRHEARPGRFDRFMEGLLGGLTQAYRRALDWSLDRRALVLALMLAAGLGAALLFRAARSELAPIEDRGAIFTSVSAPDGASLAFTERYLEEIDRIVRARGDFPEIDRLFVIAGNPTVERGIAIARTVDWSARTRKTPELAAALRPRFERLPGVSAFPVTPPSLGQGFRERPINVVLVSSDRYEAMQEVGQALLAELAAHPGIVQPDLDLRLNKPELRLRVDRERAAAAGVEVAEVARTLESLLGGREVTRYKRGADQYDVRLQTEPSARSRPQDIGQLFVRSRAGTMIPLADLVTVEEGVGPRELNHFNQRRALTLTANLAPSATLGEALAQVEAAAARVMPAGYALQLNGISREFRASSGALGLVFVLALAFIFLVLAAQFESFIDPLVILISVPLSMVGALAALALSGGTLNVYSQIGLITLVGLITKHGILIVEFANQLRQQGRALREAVLEAATLRLRPILMTTGAMVLGAIPLALASGAGAESRQPIGWVIVGGMALGTLLTVFVVPTVYLMLARRRVPGPMTGPVHESVHEPVQAAG